MRALVLAGGPWGQADQARIFTYCEADTVALERLLAAMLPRIDLPRALLRGRYMKAAAAMEFAGVPIDVPSLGLLREHWTGIQGELIGAIDADYGVFEELSFRADRWADYLAKHGIRGPDLRAAGSL